MYYCPLTWKMCHSKLGSSVPVPVPLSLHHSSLLSGTWVPMSQLPFWFSWSLYFPYLLFVFYKFSNYYMIGRIYYDFLFSKNTVGKKNSALNKNIVFLARRKYWNAQINLPIQESAGSKPLEAQRIFGTVLQIWSFNIIWLSPILENRSIGTFPYLLIWNPLGQSQTFKDMKEFISLNEVLLITIC